MAIRVGGRPGLGTLGEQVLLLGRTHIVGQAGAPRVARQGRGIPGRLTPGNITPSRPDWVTPGRTCPGISVRTSTPSSLPKDFAPMAGMSRRQLGRFAALPSRVGEKGADVGVYEGKIPDGPHVVAGPFSFPANVSSYSYSVSYNKLVGTQAGRDMMAEILAEVGRISKSKLYSSGCFGNIKGHLYAAKVKLTCPTPIQQNLVEPRYEDRDKSTFGQWRGLNIPVDTFWDTRFLRADVPNPMPVYRFQHPTKNEPWGVYVNVSASGVWTFSIKKVVQNDLLSGLWDLIKVLAVGLISYLDDILALVKNIACSMAKGYIGDLQNIANRKIPAGADASVYLSDQNARFAQVGVSASVLNGIWAGTLTGQATKAAAEAINSALCSLPPPPPGATGGTVETAKGSAGLVVAGLGAAGILAYFLLR